MMKRWYMLTVVGQDRPGIVAHVTAALYEDGCNLGEASMMRLGGNFTIMLMVQHEGGLKSLEQILGPVIESLDLHMHLDQIEGHLHEHVVPDVRISVFGADRAGIVAKITNVLSGAGLHILNLESDVGGTSERPIYIMHIEGQAREGLEALRSALDVVKAGDGIEAKLYPIETMVG
jgi:glycine cleavage system transcriptional repressor